MATDFSEDELPKKLVPDPKQSPNFRIFKGYLGKSARAGCWRLYTNAQLDDYFEIEAKDILHHESLASKDNPLGGTVCWVKSDAEIVHTRTNKSSAQAEFLRGAITASMPSAIGKRGVNVGTGSNAFITPFTPWTEQITTIIVATIAVCDPDTILCPITVSRGCPGNSVIFCE
jgi:hypothetical protein